jgi:pilus assembly protein CpaE
MAIATPQMSGAIMPLETPLLALIADDTTRETLRGVARQLGLNGALVGEGGAAAARTLLATTKPPGLLIVDIAGSEDPVQDIEDLAGLCQATTAIVAVGLVNDVRLYRRLREVGAEDYLVKPVTGEMLTAALAAAMAPKAVPAPAPASPNGARQIALIGSRGGTGTTTLAVSLAWDLAKSRRKVVLLDLDLHFGSTALSLDIEPGRGLRDLLANPDRIDTLLIDAAAGRVGEHLHILSAEEPLEDWFELSPGGLSTVLETLSSSSEFVVIDVPRVLGPLSREVLATADVIGVVTDLSLPAMRDTQRLVAMIKALRGDAQPLIIANRVGGVPGEIGLADFERAIGAKVDYSIRFDKIAAVAAAEAAKPLAEVAKTPQTLKSLRELTDGLAGARLAEKAKPSSLFKGLFGG